MADFVDSTITAEIVAAKDKLVLQADRAEQIINNWQQCSPVTEAPVDGNLYGRKDAAWEVIPSASSATWGSINGNLQDQTDLQAALDAKLDSASYTAADVKAKYESNDDTNAFTDSEKAKLSGIESGAQVNKFDYADAPSDGNQYARANGAWTVVTGGSGGATSWGNITGTLSDQTDLQAALDVKLDASTYTATDVKTKYESNPDTNAFTDAEQAKLSGIEAGAEVNNISDANVTSLTGGADSTLHFHASDRDRANHTGTQPASTISDFDTEVANNSAVAANTAKVSFPEAPLDGNAYNRKNGAWEVAGGGAVDNKHITSFESIDGKIKNPLIDGSFIGVRGTLGTADSILTYLIGKSFYPAGTTWNEVALQSLKFWSSENAQPSERGDSGVYPGVSANNLLETTIYLKRTSSSTDYGTVTGATFVCREISSTNTGTKFWIRKATATTTGTWTALPYLQ